MASSRHQPEMDIALAADSSNDEEVSEEANTGSSAHDIGASKNQLSAMDNNPAPTPWASVDESKDEEDPQPTHYKPHTPRECNTTSIHDDNSNDNKIGKVDTGADPIHHHDTNNVDVISPWWTCFTDLLHKAILSFVVSLAQFAARRPWTVVIGVSVGSILIMVIGLATNFVVVYDPEEFLIPFGTPIEKQYNWIADTFRDSQNVHIAMLLHQNGDTVITVNTTRKVLELMEAVSNTPGYQKVCSQGNHVDIYGNRTCWSYSIARFWDFNSTYYDATIHNDLDVMKVVSQATFPYGGTPVAHDIILGNSERGPMDGTNLITFAQSYIINIELPYTPEVEALEYSLIQMLYELRTEWSQLPDPVHLEFLAQLSLEMEVERAIRQDLPLIPFVFLIMGNFCSVVFFQRHKVKSRWLLGYGAVFTIVCSILTGFGLLFIAGVPVSSMLLVLPFVIFGVGLDDTFIITASFLRTNPTSDIAQRVRETMNDIGLSITLTTITTTVAFILSSLSTIRAIRWLGWYATLTIFIDFMYQITFYVALLVLDERRMQSNRRDVCFWIVVPREETQNDSVPDGELPASLATPSDNNTDESDHGHDRKQSGSEEDASKVETLDESTSGLNLDHPQLVLLASVTSEETQLQCESDLGDDAFANGQPSADIDNEENDGNYHISDRLMLWYARRIVPRRWFQIPVCVVFLGFFALCCYRTTLLRQEFRTQDFVPGDSYVSAFLDSVSAFMTFDYVTAAYFRHENQSDPAVQDEMRSYLDELTELSHIGVDPPFCWVKDLPVFQSIYKNQVGNMTLNEQLNYALSIPALNEMYGPDIIFDNSTGKIVASRCWVYMKAIDMDDVQDQLVFYENQNEVSLAQPMNTGRQVLDFFSFEYIYFVWEFYAAIKRELVNSTIAGTVAVAVISVLLIPHWSAICFVLPFIIMLYLDVMGTIQMMGLHVDSMTFVCIIVSVGLLVDFLMHVLLRYYESPGSTRLEKVENTLVTMGASIFVGGLSTLLGVLPLSLGSSMVLKTVFACFFAMVSLGVAHGLVLLPVVLCLVGPINKGSTPHVNEDKGCRYSRASPEIGPEATSGDPLGIQ